jgi:nitrous oxidase accessory protein
VLSVLWGWLLASAVLVVGQDGSHRSLQDALAASQPGDVIEVRGGVHQGPILVDRPVSLVGVEQPILDGGGAGTVITLAASGASLRGFVIRGSGSDLNRGDAGVAVQARGVVVEGNRVEDALFGVSLDNAHGSVLRGNTIRGKPLPPAERGDGIRLWYSSDVLVEDNYVEGVRDCVAWYSSNLRLRHNTIENGRYGLHFMYDDAMELSGNILRNNSVAAYVMYGRNVTLRNNLLSGSRGPSGFGLGLKDVDGLVLEDNWLVNNRVGAWIDSSPSSLDASSTYRRNVFAFNDIALTLQPAVQRNVFTENVFRDNHQQVSVAGGGTLKGNRWSVDGRGNYWGDYRGFDAGGDGVGDVPYRVEGLMGALMDRRAELRLFQFGLAAEAVEFAARAFPGLKPTPRLTDEAPLTRAPVVSTPPGGPTANPWATLGVGLGLLAAAGGVMGMVMGRRGDAVMGQRGAGQPATERRPHPDPLPAGEGRHRLSRWERPAAGRVRVDARDSLPSPGVTRAGAALEVQGLTKRYGRMLAVDGLSFSLAAGEAVALWGPNGAGKTTALKCVLGLLPCSGRVSVAGQDALRDGRHARRLLAYVPQEVALQGDLSIAETVELYARLRRVPVEQGLALLGRLGLEEHARKPVGALSGGMRQRLALALALAGQPRVVLLDEPTSNLDPAGRELLAALLREARTRGTAVLLASHRLEEVETLANRVLVLERGRLAVDCAPGELAQRLGLQQELRLRVGLAERLRAVEVLAAAGLTASPNGVSVRVAVPAAEKALPFRVLEQAGIAVVDFSLEDGKAERQEDHRGRG